MAAPRLRVLDARLPVLLATRILGRARAPELTSPSSWIGPGRWPEVPSVSMRLGGLEPAWGEGDSSGPFLSIGTEWVAGIAAGLGQDEDGFETGALAGPERISSLLAEGLSADELATLLRLALGAGEALEALDGARRRRPDAPGLVTAAGWAALALGPSGRSVLERWASDVSLPPAHRVAAEEHARALPDRPRLLSPGLRGARDALARGEAPSRVLEALGGNVAGLVAAAEGVGLEGLRALVKADLRHSARRAALVALCARSSAATDFALWRGCLTEDARVALAATSAWGEDGISALVEALSSVDDLERARISETLERLMSPSRFVRLLREVERPSTAPRALRVRVRTLGAEGRSAMSLATAAPGRQACVDGALDLGPAGRGLLESWAADLELSLEARRTAWAALEASAAERLAALHPELMAPDGPVAAAWELADTRPTAPADEEAEAVPPEEAETDRVHPAALGLLEPAEGPDPTVEAAEAMDEALVFDAASEEGADVGDMDEASVFDAVSEEGARFEALRAGRAALAAALRSGPERRRRLELLASAESVPDRVRAEALHALLREELPIRPELLLRLLGPGAGPELKSVAVTEAVARPGHAMEPIAAFAADSTGDAQSRLRAIRWLGARPDRRATRRYLTPLLDDPDPSLRKAALHAAFSSLRYVPDAGIEEGLCNLVARHEDREARSFALRALGAFGFGERAAQVLSEARRHPDAEVRSVAEDAAAMWNRRR